ncbi:MULTISPECIES: amidohydrolase family protein [Arenibacter]|uniref:amidohydrolase family protein n=1 Tax=Arenibacter TaxID=178469 RepID=UPI0004DF5B58|nr:MULTISPECIES: amidohydrolase family protein [Arenibacter]GBF20684.1 amidohydrolase [Arenibacter sp. NBRC 103722]
MKKPWIAFLILLTISCVEKNEYYTLDDFDKVDKIDTHIHVFADRNSFVNQAKKDNFRLLNIMVDLSKGEELIKEQYDYCLAQKKGHPEDYEFATSFSIEDWDNPDFTKNTIAWLDKSFEEGAIAVKVWKNIGMVFRDKDNELIMVDNPKLDTIFDYLASKKIPLVGHLGEPKNCWLPLDEMTTNNDRKYFSEHPQYHMYQHPELPSYEEQIAARDRMLEKHPNLVFIGAHMGSLEWSVDELAKRLDKFPNMSIDLAARMGQVFYQTVENREKVRAFFIKYQDRLLYATDLSDDGEENVGEMQKEMHKMWLTDWRFFVTDELMASDLVNEEFRGLKLPKEAVDKIYFQNAKKWLKMFPTNGI